MATNIEKAKRIIGAMKGDIAMLEDFVHRMEHGTQDDNDETDLADTLNDLDGYWELIRPKMGG